MKKKDKTPTHFVRLESKILCKATISQRISFDVECTAMERGSLDQFDSMWVGLSSAVKQK